MSGTLSNIFQGQPIPGQPTGADTSTSFPLWQQQYIYNLSNAAQNLAGQDYTPYPGPQIAAPSASTNDAWWLANANVHNYQGALNSATGLTQSAGTPITASDISQYMSPYTSQVVGALQQAANYNLFNNQLPQIQDRFVSAGQSRSPQEMQATNNALYQSNQALDQATAQALQSGYQGALGTALGQKQLQQTAGAQFGQLGALTQELGAGDVAQLAGAGQAQDAYSQANINAAMNNFYAQQQWPYQNLSYASNIIRGQAIPSNTMQVGLTSPSQSAYTASPLATGLGVTLGASALGGGASGQSNPYALGLRRGGRVRGARRGALEMGMAA